VTSPPRKNGGLLRKGEGASQNKGKGVKQVYKNVGVLQ
jgi:hypothetical protein